MRKHIIEPAQQDINLKDSEWLNLEEQAEVEISSEDPSHPIENALLLDSTSGWLAGEPGRQTIRLVFAEPQSLRLIRLYFFETEVERTQEYVLRWSPGRGESFHEIVRQQWHFSPGGSTSELEDHSVELEKVALLELSIMPDIGGGDAIASLALLRLA